MTQSLISNVSIQQLVEKEYWADIKGYEGYFQVSSWGRIRTVTRKISYTNPKTKKTYTRTIRGHIRKPVLTIYGYYQVKLDIKNKPVYHAPVHQLVAQAFLPNPNHYTEIHHKDYNKTNNYIDNLMWCSRKFNQQNMAIHYYGDEQTRKQKALRCKQCGKIIDKNKTGLCVNCLKKYRGTHINGKLITKEKLLNTIKQKHGNLVATGKEFGVTDNAIRKHLKYYKLSIHAKNY